MISINIQVYAYKPRKRPHCCVYWLHLKFSHFTLFVILGCSLGWPAFRVLCYNADLLLSGGKENDKGTPSVIVVI